jgi:hypothetical protein
MVESGVWITNRERKWLRNSYFYSIILFASGSKDIR